MNKASLCQAQALLHQSLWWEKEFWLNWDFKDFHLGLEKFQSMFVRLIRLCAGGKVKAFALEREPKYMKY